MTKENRENMGKLRQEVHEATHMDGMIDKLANSLQTGEPVQISTSAGSAGSSNIMEPEPEHFDPSDLVQYISDPTQSNNSETYEVGKQGMMLLSNNEQDGQKKPQQKKTASHSQQKQSHNDYGDLNGLIYSILAFPFSAKNRDKEIKQLQAAIDEKTAQIKVARIMSNTKNIIKNASNFYSVEDGSIRMEFTILGHKYSMRAKGPFSGQEYLYPTVEGDTIVGLVMRENGGEFENVTDNFQIQIKKGWKEKKTSK